ncbi:LytR/AlgR family response regulator transcription factor [Aneurinibacillus migulanus]|uniref:LytR/AlgR family response regulator transcription factor n=1 Tax=Aneurinibacillus migulanus TaxID=47500 RepID=UPI00209CFE33|nr:LytTR family DNA-binding domain-containing protein [Aneurinibacillus migulanus]MCP1356203.1 LytTR family DNA-binding domain-containing protein [Aneurinibacillus migulanus]
MNILVCEDNLIQAQALTSHLQTFDYVQRVDVVTTGEEMISVVLKKNDITALFLDIDLPGMNGLEAYGILKMQGCDIPAILITGLRPAASDTYHLGIVDVVEKPYLTPRLEEALKKLRLHIVHQNFIQAGGVYVPVITDELALLSPKDILFFEAGARELKVHTLHNTFEAKYIPLKIYEKYLRNQGFVFSHRAYLVNTRKIKYIDHTGIHFIGDFQHVASVAEDKLSILKKILQRINISPI